MTVIYVNGVGTIAILQISVLPLSRTVIYVHGVGAIASYKFTFYH